MPRFLVLTSVLAMAACTPMATTPVATTATGNTAASDAAPAALSASPPDPGLATPGSPVAERSSAEKPTSPPVLPLAYHRVSSQGLSLSVVCFDDRQHRLIVADQPDGCGSKWRDARSAAASHNGLAAINGGFFTPEGKPLGLVMAGGSRRGHLNRSSLGAGMYVSSHAGSAIIRREKYPTFTFASNADELLQAGPMLLEHGEAVAGLSRDKYRPRSFVAWDGRHHWAIGYADSCSLAGLASALGGTRIDGFKATTALNLDGGRSSDLWVGSQVRHGGKTHRPLLSKHVRNYLVLIPH